jgi:hypothetical protein
MCVTYDLLIKYLCVCVYDLIVEVKWVYDVYQIIDTTDIFSHRHHRECVCWTSIISWYSLQLSRPRWKKKKKTWLLDEFEGRRVTRHQVREWGIDVRHGARTGVSERLPSAHPVATSTWCVRTQVHAGVVEICSDQPVCDRCVVFDFVTRWKEDLHHAQPYICAASDDGGLLPRLF